MLRRWTGQGLFAPLVGELVDVVGRGFRSRSVVLMVFALIGVLVGGARFPCLRRLGRARARRSQLEANRAVVSCPHPDQAVEARAVQLLLAPEPRQGSRSSWGLGPISQTAFLGQQVVLSWPT